MTPAVLKRVVADVLRRAIEDTWSRDEECRRTAWDFLHSRGAGVLFSFFGVSQKHALRAIADAEKKPPQWSNLDDERNYGKR